MLKFNEKDLYQRCGISTRKPKKSAKFFCKINGYVYSRQLVLKTFKGYIPVKNINSFFDIFKSKNYVDDELEWIATYDEEKCNSYDKEQVRKLSYRLKKHWNGKVL